MSRKSALRLCVSASAMLALYPVSAYAQDGSDDEQATSQDTDMANVGEIIVTANKRSQNLQEVPIAIAAFAAETLTTQGIKSVVDLPQLTPGLGFTRTLVGTNAFLRGVGTTSAGYSTEVPIATYVDGLYLPNSAASSFSFNNIERIEVLKGPQGTLYGRNTTGGLIHVITKEPGTDPELDVSASYANYDTVQLNFYGSTPLSDTLAANMAVLYINQGDGWGENVFTGNDVFKFKDIGVQGKLRWDPGSDTTITLRGFFDKVETDQGNSVAMYPGSVGTDGSTYPGEYRINTRFDPFAKQRMYSVSLKAEQGLGFATLTSTTGYINNRSPSLQTQGSILGQPTLTGTAINLGGLQTAKTFSQELQLASDDNGGPLQWIVGAFYYHDKTMIDTQVYGTCVDGVCTPNPRLIPSRTTGFQTTESISGYAEGTYSITDATRLTLGLRYTSDNKKLEGTFGALPGFPNSIPAFPPTIPASPEGVIDTDVTYGKLTWRAVLAQDLSDDVHAYASYNRGFKSGGYNPISFTNPPSRPEVLDAFELGVKSQLFDRMLRLNVAAFYYDYKDIQLRTTAPPAPPGGSILLNAASSEIKGVDIDFDFAPVSNFSITGGVEFLDAKYKSFPDAVCTAPSPSGFGTVSFTCDLAGARLPQAPKFSYSLGATYTLETGIGDIEFNANDGYKSTFYWEPDNRLKQKGYHVLNASITWSDPDSGLSVQGFGRNLGGEYYFSSAGGAGGNDGYIPAAPRTYGIKVRYQY